MTNRRNEKLDKLIDKLVDVTFTDGEAQTGILGFGREIFPGITRNMYSLYVFETNSYTNFYKTHVKSIKEHK